jgi:asparagine synthetase B (glutamine-hydrolysing)
VYHLYRMDPLEVASGWVHGFDPKPLPSRTSVSPRQVLDRVLLRCLQRSPCVIAFSGGRDSSALLGVAVAVARREGLPLPVALTLTYPGVPQTDESLWQRLVLDHLGVPNQVEIQVGTEHDVLGPIVARLLRRYGSVWPPNLAPTWRLMDNSRGGSLIIGECGDEVFGPKRITPITKMVAWRGRVDRRLYPMAAASLAPAPVRRQLIRRSPSRYQRNWLRPSVKSLVEHRDAEDAAALTLHAGHNAWQYTRRRAITRSFETHHAIAHDMDVDYVAPFAEPDFVAAVAHAAGFWGWSGRAATMIDLFGDVLPRAVLERGTKATFERAVFNEYGRAFAGQWTGRGVDSALVDPEVLHRIWLSDQPNAGTMVLMQQAWLASQPVSSESAAR